MKRRNCYAIGSGHKFSREQHDRLREALPGFELGFAVKREFNVSQFGDANEKQAFTIWPEDHGYLNNAEINAAYWYWRGVLIANGMLKIGSVSDGIAGEEYAETSSARSGHSGT